MKTSLFQQVLSSGDLYSHLHLYWNYFFNSLLSMEAQVNSVSRAAVYQLHLVRRLRPYLPADCLARVVHALVISRLDCSNALCMRLPLKVTRKLH